jgi:hypothetical protein
MFKKCVMFTGVICGVLLYSGCNSASQMLDSYVQYKNEKRGLLTSVEDIKTKTQDTQLTSIYAKYYRDGYNLYVPICKNNYIQIIQRDLISFEDKVLIRNIDNESANRLEKHLILKMYIDLVKSRGNTIKYYAGKLNKELTRNLFVELDRSISRNSAIYSSAMPVLMEYDNNGKLISVFTATVITYKNGGMSYYGSSKADFVIYFGDNARKIENRFGGKKLNDYFLRETKF